MPAKPSYALRLIPAIEALQKSSARWIGRRDLEDILAVSKTVAWRVLRHCQAQKGPGGVLLFERLALIERLEELAAEGGTIAREVARHRRVEDLLAAMRGYVRSRQTAVVSDEQAPALLESRLQSLPPNITFSSRSLHVEFSDTKEFLAAIGAIVYALENDYEAISEFIESCL